MSRRINSCRKSKSYNRDNVEKVHKRTRKKLDELVPYFLSALKEVPHSGSKFSANQLIFGHNIRGLMSIAREIWTQDDPAKPKLKMSTVAYVQKLK